MRFALFLMLCACSTDRSLKLDEDRRIRINSTRAAAPQVVPNPNNSYATDVVPYMVANRQMYAFTVDGWRCQFYEGHSEATMQCWPL